MIYECNLLLQVTNGNDKWHSACANIWYVCSLLLLRRLNRRRILMVVYLKLRSVLSVKYPKLVKHKRFTRTQHMQNEPFKTQLCPVFLFLFRQHHSFYRISMAHSSISEFIHMAMYLVTYFLRMFCIMGCDAIKWTTLMTSSNGNIFRVTGHLCREFTGQRWIPRTKASDAELWCFLWPASE